MFRILKNGDRLAITIAEKKLAIERTKERRPDLYEKWRKSHL